MDITKDPIPELIRRIAVPASIGIFFHTMYNVVDTFFAGKISTDAIAALSLSFPIFFMIIAMASGLSQGSTALIANALGEQDAARAQTFSLQSISFGLILSILLSLGGLLAAPSMFRQLGATEEYLAISMSYMSIVLCGAVFFVSQGVLNASLNAQGDTNTFRNLLIIGFLLNCILDPWFLFGGLGIPAMGIGGIALATVLIQVVGCLYLIHRLKKTQLWNDLDLSRMKPDMGYFKDIAVQGIPAGLNMMTVAIGIFVITWFAAKFSKEGVAAYGIATRIEQIALMPSIGLNIAVITITGQNNGARLYDRISTTWKTTIRYGLILMVMGGVFIFQFAGVLMNFFTDDAAVIRIGGDYLKIAAITLPSYIILFQTVYMLQGLKRPMYALGIGLYRQIVAPCAVFYFLAFRLDWKLDGIWWGVFLVTWSAAIITLLYGMRVLGGLVPSEEVGVEKGLK